METLRDIAVLDDMIVEAQSKLSGKIVGDLVLCIHCMGSKTDPCDDDEKPCYLCGGVGRITEGLKQRTIDDAEAFGHPPVVSI